LNQTSDTTVNSDSPYDSAINEEEGDSVCAPKRPRREQPVAPAKRSSKPLTEDQKLFAEYIIAQMADSFGLAITSIRTDVTEVKTSVKNVENKVEGLRKKAATQGTELSVHSKRLEKVDKMEPKLVSIEEKLSLLEESQKDAIRKCHELQEQVEVLTQQSKEVAGVIASGKKGQSNLERVLEKEHNNYEQEMARSGQVIIGKLSEYFPSSKLLEKGTSMVFSKIMFLIVGVKFRHETANSTTRLTSISI
jgi:Mg2+ and Co2+ transporter CorA